MPTTRVLIPYRIAAVLLLGLVILSSQQPRALGEPSSGEDRHEKPYGLIFITVWGPDNRPVYGVKIKVRRADQKKASGKDPPITRASSRRECPRARPTTLSGPI